MCTKTFQAQWSTERCPASGSFRLEKPIGKAVVSIGCFIIPLSNNYWFIKTGKLPFQYLALAGDILHGQSLRCLHTAIQHFKWACFKEVVLRFFRNHMKKKLADINKYLDVSVGNFNEFSAVDSLWSATIASQMWKA